ncbi:ribulose-phosphate 3-epimerase [Sphingobacterium sp. SGR-19]|uniref:ribulose-phosphate 3-epimerase n=1 Tax=Sphingobacterium sp. SGR-19 TaxID=2710886 RepID=UPI0013EB082C|nr:ribulose-phosphate 3-epimerase [Sphingobacterium sp. SGR-19]NGM63718.1 ribulose-phosphate 3-epimerase [Sphingobacterium sp. SGR-19]
MPITKHLIAPSVLAADFANLYHDIQVVNKSEADWFHIDIMDGVFVPNISFGFPVMQAIAKYATKPLDVHLMIVDPDRYLETCKNSGASIITVHYEACTHLHRTLAAIKELGCKAGVALNPHTPVSLLKDVIRDIDLVCIMSVNPGFGGQKFIEQTYAKIKELRDVSEGVNDSLLIEIDGGVGTKNAAKLLEAGADVLVAGSSVFGAEDPTEAVRQLKNVLPITTKI